MKKIIVGIGEVLWDMLPTGKALGGAPANFAYNATCLGEHGMIVSAVGRDENGREIIDLLKAKGCDGIIVENDRPTGTVDVTLDEAGVPTYIITEDVAWDHIPFTSEMKELASKADAVCFGSLVQRAGSKQSVLDFLGATSTNCLKIFDINLRQSFWTADSLRHSMEIADILKINDEEIKLVAGLFGLGDDMRTACRRLIEQMSLRCVLLTKGAEGSEVITTDSIDSLPAGQVKVVDTVGAGDAFTAAFTVAMLNGSSLEEAHRLATKRTAYICSKEGAMPD